MAGGPLCPQPGREGRRCRALARPTAGWGTAGTQPGQGATARVAGMGGLILAPPGAGGAWCPQGSTTAPREAHRDPSDSGPSPTAGSCPSLHAPWAGAGHGRLQRAPSKPHWPRWRCPWKHPRILGEAGLRPEAQDGCSPVGSGAGAAGGPAEPSCGDVAGMCVGGRQGGGEGGRGSGRGSSSFDKQLPEHFQTVVSDRHARRLRACARTDGAHATGQQVGSPCRPWRGDPCQAAPGPGADGRWARARRRAVPGRAGMLSRVMGTLLQVPAAGALPQALLPARGSAGASPGAAWPVCEGQPLGLEPAAASSQDPPGAVAPGELPPLPWLARGRRDGVCGSGGIATPRNATRQQGVMGSSSCPSRIPKQHGHGMDLLLCRTSLSR